MSEKFPLQAISDISEPGKVRIVIFINGELVHVPLGAILKAIQQQADDLEARVAALETP